MPELPCKTCKGMCGFLCHSQFCMAWMVAWSNDQPLPECEFWLESAYHGLEGVRP